MISALSGVRVSSGSSANSRCRRYLFSNSATVAPSPLVRMRIPPIERSRSTLAASVARIAWYGDPVSSTGALMALKVPALQAKLADMGFDIVASTPEDYSRKIRSEIELWSGIVRQNNIKVD